MGRVTWRPLVWHLKPPALPAFDPEWNQQCLGCKHVMVDVDVTDLGVRVLRCSRARIVGGGGKVKPGQRLYCLEALDECREQGWHDPKDA